MARSLGLATLLVAVCGAAALGAENLSVLPDPLAEGPARRMVDRYLKAQAQAAFERRAAAYEQIKTTDDCVAHQQRVRALLLEQLGELPERTPLHPRVVGELAGEGYRAEKLIYESQPGHFVTAVLFLPEAPPPYPAVLVPCGHSADGKASNQRMCILLARHGIAAMTYDPIGQGERVQLLDAQGRPRFRSTEEHTLLGAASMLVGRNTATYRIWDGIRSLDYLASRPEIDADRLGVTGCSGGGTLTSYLMALDDRVACAAPSCYITSFERLLATIGPQDAEQNIHAQIALGIDHADYLLLRAPKPTLILASTHDFFDIDGTWAAYREAKRFYTRLGFAERVSIVETDARHGYPQPQREAMARWMSRWLLGRDVAITEPEFATHSGAEVRCTPRGQALLLDGARSVTDLNVELDERLALKRRNVWRPGYHQQALSEVRRVTGIRPLAGLPAPQVRAAGRVERDGYHIEKLILAPEEGILLPALLFRPARATGDRVLYVHGRGKQADAAIDGPLEKLVRGGAVVLAIDARGVGETGAGADNLWGDAWGDIFLSYLLGKSLLAMRAEDVLVAARYLSLLDEAAPPAPVRLHAVGAMTPPALHAAALEPALFAAVELSQHSGSWADYLKKPDTRGRMVNVVHGALRVYDLPDLIASLPAGLVKVSPAEE